MEETKEIMGTILNYGVFVANNINKEDQIQSKK
jgi:hypothetical protein